MIMVCKTTSDVEWQMKLRGFPVDKERFEKMRKVQLKREEEAAQRKLDNWKPSIQTMMKLNK